jgi:hypothetical protein
MWRRSLLLSVCLSGLLALGWASLVTAAPQATTGTKAFVAAGVEVPLPAKGGLDHVPGGFYIRPPLMSTLPTIDGVVNYPGEWTGAAIKDVSDTLGVIGDPDAAGTVYLFMGYGVHATLGDVLVLGVKNLQDTTVDDEDQIGLYIDDNNDGAWDGSTYQLEGNFWVTVFRPDTLAFRVIHPGGNPSDTTWVNLAPGVTLCGWALNPTTNTMDYEAMIAVTPDTVDMTFPYVNWQINAEVVDSVVGFWMFCLDAGTGDYDGVWPQVSSSAFEAMGFGDLWPRSVMLNGFDDFQDYPNPPGRWPQTKYGELMMTFENTTNTPQANMRGWLDFYVYAGGHWNFNRRIQGPQVSLSAHQVQDWTVVVGPVPASVNPTLPIRCFGRVGPSPADTLTMYDQRYFELHTTTINTPGNIP